MLTQILIIAIFLGILISLGSGLFYLVNDKGQSKRTVTALTWRIGLSVGLFLLLMLLVALGVIKPHGIYPSQPSTNVSNSQSS